MKYKALLLDVDGTLVPVGPYTAPSDAVRRSIEEALKTIAVSIVSGRPLAWLSDLFQTLRLVHPCIMNGGSQIVAPQTGKILWEQPMDADAVSAILAITRRNVIPFLVNDNGIERHNPVETQFEKPLAIQLSYFASKETSDQCITTLQEIPHIAFHKFFSWHKDRPYTMEVYITHAEATKYHAATELARLLGIATSEMIGVGDSRNDIPLLNVCGLKVAMENADNKLKKIAHYIAPSVEEDGVADVIRTFISPR